MTASRYLLILIFPLLSLLVIASQKPHIIYINADDLGVMDVGFMGDKRYHTPNLDKLAKQGMIFTNGYSPSANCAPSRAACISGQFASRTGVYTVGSSERGSVKTRKLIPIENIWYLNDDSITLMDEMKRHGYTTCQIGKWHVGKEPNKQGVDVNIAGSRWGQPPGGYFSPYGNDKLKDGPEGEYLTDRLTAEAIKFIDNHLSNKKDTPFFLYFPYYSIHTPLQGRKDILKLYKGRKDVNANYASMIHALDENVGRLLDHLDQINITNNSVVIFSSDNGGICQLSPQTPHRAGKGSYFEGGIRVPITIRWPGKVKAGSTCDTPVTGLDFYPTLLDMAGGKAAEGKVIDGNSLMPLLTPNLTPNLTKKESFPQRNLYWHYPVYLQKYAGEADDAHDPLFRTRPGSSMRAGKWKLHELFEDGRLELYDLEADPGERNNLATSHPNKLAELKAQLYAWRKKVNAEVPTELNPEYDPTSKDDGREKRMKQKAKQQKKQNTKLKL